MKIIISTNESFNIPIYKIFRNIFLKFILLINHRQSNHLLKTDKNFFKKHKLKCTNCSH